MRTNPHIAKTPRHPSFSISKQSNINTSPGVLLLPRQHLYYFGSCYKKPITEEELKKYTSSINPSFQTIETQNPLNKFISTLNSEERQNLKISTDEIETLPFVNEIEFNELETPTLIIRLSEMNEETEEKIYQIEYDLLKHFKNNIDFLVLPA